MKKLIPVFFEFLLISLIDEYFHDFEFVLVIDGINSLSSSITCSLNKCCDNAVIFQNKIK